MQVTATQKRNKAHIKVTHLKTSTVSMVRLRPSMYSESPTILMIPRATSKRNKGHINVTHLRKSTVSMVRLRPSIDSESPTILMIPRAT